MGRRAWSFSSICNCVSYSLDTLLRLIELAVPSLTVADLSGLRNDDEIDFPL